MTAVGIEFTTTASYSAGNESVKTIMESTIYSVSLTWTSLLSLYLTAGIVNEVCIIYIVQFASSHGVFFFAYLGDVTGAQVAFNARIIVFSINIIAV